MQQAEKMIDIPEGEPWTPYLQRINQLFIDEKQARHDGDNAKLVQICSEIVNLSFETKEYKRLREFLASIMKKRGQSKKAMIEMINLTMKRNLEVPRDEKLQTLDTIRNLTEGKLFLEVFFSETHSEK